MADVSRSVPLSKKLSNAADFNSKHIYDDVFSAPMAKNLNSSAFSVRVEDYREIFSPSDASLGSSIPILDLPPVDPTYIAGRGRSSGVDYAGVFGGLGDDDRIGVPSEEFFAGSKKKAKNDAPPSRSSTKIKIPASKSREFICDSGSCLESKSPAKTRVTFSKSQEFCVSSKDSQTSRSASTHQEFHGVKHQNVPHQKTDQLSEDGAAEMRHINSKNTHMFDEAGPARKSGLDKETCIGKGKRQGKHAKVVSDLETDKQINDHEAQLQEEIGGAEHYTFDATRSTREANLKSQTFSASTLSSLPQIFDSSDYFRRSSSRRSKSFTNNMRSHAAAGSSSPLLEEELDVNSAAAVSAAVMKKAIEEAEAKIQWAKEFLKGMEGDGSTKLTFKDIIKVKTTGTPSHSYEACGPKQNNTPEVQARRQNKAVDDEKLLQRKSRSSASATSENSQLSDEVGMLNEKLHGATAQEYTATKDCVGSRSTCPAEIFEDTHDSLDQAVSVNDAELKEKTYSHDVPKSTELSHTYEGGGEWEAAKHLSQLFSGVKNRFVSFISKQADTEKIVIQEDIPSVSGAVEQSEGSTYQVRDAETHIKRAPNQDHLEEEVKMNYYASSGVGEIAQVSDGIGMEIHKSEKNEVKTTAALEQGKVEDVTTSLDVEMLISQQCDPSEPEQELNQIEGLESIVVEEGLIQDDVQDQGQEISDDYVGWGFEKCQMGSNERVELKMPQEVTYQSSGYDSKEETNCNVKNEIGKGVQDEEPVVEGVNESFDGKDGTRRQEEACNGRETEMPEDLRKKLEDVEMVEETCTDELQESVQEAKLCTREDDKTIEQKGSKSKLTVGLIEVADDTSEQDEHVAVAHDESENDESLVLSKDEEACLHDERSQYAQQGESSSGGEGMMAEPGTQLVREDICEQRSCSVEVADDVLEHDDDFPAMGHICQQDQSSLRRNKETRGCDDTEHDDDFPAMGHICQQDQSSLRRNKETRGCDDTDQDLQDVDFTTIEKERMAESTSTASETEGNLEQPSFVHTVSDLIGKEMCEQTGCSIEVADETLDHEECPLADLCQKEVHSCLNGDSEGYAHDNHNTNGHAQDAKCSFEDERMTESTTVTSEPECTVEEPSSVHTIAKQIGEEMAETSSSARDWGNLDIFEEEIEEASEILPCKNIQKTRRETDVDAGQKLANEETFATDTGSENQCDDSEVRTDIEVDMASDQDTKMHATDISCKRKRWFENKDETEEFRRSSVLLRAEIARKLDEENSQGSKADDRVEIHIDEKVNESGEGTNVRQRDAGINLEDDPHSTEATHRRKRWFENRDQEVLHNPSVFDGARMTTQMGDQIAEESELDDSLQSCADKVVNEGKEGIDVRQSDVDSDQVESRAIAEAAHRRRRWFESGEKLGPAQRPSILEDDGVKTDQEVETEMGEDTAKHDSGLGETSTSGIMENKHQNQLNNKEKEKERERVAVDRAMREARQRAFAAQERAAVEARQKAAAAAQTRQVKDSSEAKSGSDKASMDAKLKAQRAAVERATVEARERALQKAVSEKAAYKSKEKDPKNQTSGSSFNSGYSSAPFANEKSSGAVSDSPQRRKAISEKNRRTMERAAKALEEKNMRDYLVQKEQAERSRFADALTAEVKRWLTGKEGNLPAMLSTLQYILGPDSGWQPIPLTDLVTSTTAVRKAYKRAALCVHPDKLQQRCATTQQKYICEKVFDLLKDAWHKFNPDDR